MKPSSGVLRPAGFDELGLRRALSDRMLPLLVAAMAFLAALALAGWFGAASLARHWREGAGSALTVQIPDPTTPALVPSAEKATSTRLAAVVTLLSATPGVTQVHPLSDEELGDLLRPWLGTNAERMAVPLPAVVAVHLMAGAVDMAALDRQIQSVSPGTMIEDHGFWLRRLSLLARSLQACSGLALLLVASVAAAVIAVATRAGLASRREAIEIVHGLGATDGYIAGRFAARATLLAAIGGLAGATAAVPVLLTLASFAAPFSGALAAVQGVADLLSVLPFALWFSLPVLPAGASLIGFLTAHGTVRRWLRRLP